MSEEETTTTITQDKETEELPSLPKRPQSPFEKLKSELIEAFPDLDEKLITTILILSKGKLDQCFNALLYYNDPSTLSNDELNAIFKPELPKRNDQLEKDELMAKKLAKKYSKQERYNNYLLQDDNEDKDSFEKFMEDDLPQIKQQFNKNVEEAQTKISSWFGTLNKKFNENTNTQAPLFSAIGGSSQQQLKPRVSSSSSIPSSRSRYDYGAESMVNQTNSISLNDNTNEDIYGTPKKKQSFEETNSEKKINVVKPEPIEMEINTEKKDLKKVDEEVKKDDEDFLVDDSDEDN